MKRVALYVRVSTQEQAKEGYSIDEQIDRLKDYCRSFGWAVSNVYCDAGFSGGNMSRPELQKLLSDVKANKCDAVLVYKLDRLSRSQKDTLELIEDHFLKNNVDFISMSENFDTSSPFGRAMIGILAVFAQLEREQIKERMTLGREGRAKEGKFHGGGFAPIGYDYIDGELIVNDYEAMQIKELHALFQQGYNYTQIDRFFAERGYTHKHGQWDRKRIKLTLTNDLYCGYIKFNGQKFKGNHEPIISDEIYNQTMKIYNSKDNSKYVNTGRSAYLGGLLYCKRCTARYALNVYKQRGKTYKYYACHSRRKSQRVMVRDPNCKNKIWKAEELDRIIFDEIRKLAFDPNQIKTMRKSDDSDKSEIIKKEIAKIDNQRSRFIDLYGTGTLSVDELQSKILPLNDRRQKLQTQLEAQKQPSRIDEAEAYKLIVSFSDALNNGTFEQVRALINALISRIELDGEDITIYWKFV